jgi:pectin methylesterase-like acyl-CoA thioesterase
VKKAKSDEGGIAMSHIAGIGLGSALAAVALVAFAAAIAGGETYYVATDGDDAHAGTKTAPFRTIQKAASVARAGDTVLVRAGVYQGHVYLRISGEPGKPVVFKNYPGERPAMSSIPTGPTGSRSPATRTSRSPMPAPSSPVRGTGSSATTQSPSSATGRASSSGSPMRPIA